MKNIMANKAVNKSDVLAERINESKIKRFKFDTRGKECDS